MSREVEVVGLARAEKTVDLQEGSTIHIHNQWEGPRRSQQLGAGTSSLCACTYVDAGVVRAVLRYVHVEAHFRDCLSSGPVTCGDAGPLELRHGALPRCVVDPPHVVAVGGVCRDYVRTCLAKPHGNKAVGGTPTTNLCPTQRRTTDSFKRQTSLTFRLNHHGAVSVGLMARDHGPDPVLHQEVFHLGVDCLGVSLPQVVRVHHRRTALPAWQQPHAVLGKRTAKIDMVKSSSEAPRSSPHNCAATISRGPARALAPPSAVGACECVQALYPFVEAVRLDDVVGAPTLRIAAAGVLVQRVLRQGAYDEGLSGTCVRDVSPGLARGSGTTKHPTMHCGVCSVPDSHREQR